MVPMTSTKADAEAIARFSKFMPIGERGFGSNCGMTDFTPQKAPVFMKESNDDASLPPSYSEAGTIIVMRSSALKGLMWVSSVRIISRTPWGFRTR